MLKNKKFLSLLLIACMLLGTLTSCGSGEKSVFPGNKRTGQGHTAKVSVTPGPSETPSVTPTPTNVVTNTPTPTGTMTLKGVTPAFGTEQYNAEQQAFDELLNEILAFNVDGWSILDVHEVFEEPEKFGLTKQMDFGHYGESDMQQYKNEINALMQKVQAVNYDALTPSQQVNYDRAIYDLSMALRVCDLNTDTFCSIFGSNGNVLDDISLMMTEYALLNEQDVKDLLQVAATLPAYLDEAYAEAKRLYIDGDCVLTEYMMDITVDKAEHFLAKTNNPFIVAFQENIKEANLSADLEAYYVEEFSNLVLNEIVPAYSTFCSELATFYRYCTDDLYGMYNLEGGSDYFVYMAQNTIGTEMSIDEIFDYLEVKFEGEMTEYNNTANLHPQSQQNYLNGVTGYTETDPKAILNSLKDFIKDEYPTIPETDFIVSALAPALRMEGVAAYFMIPQYDNPERRVIRFNPQAVYDTSALFSTLAHEGYPGHLYQMAYWENCVGCRAYNKTSMYLGYIEGWATTIERKVYNYIISDPYQAQFYGNDRLFSLDISALLAIGAHAYGWEVSDASAFLSKWGYGQFASAYYEDSIINPEVYLSYTVGHYLLTDTIDCLMEKYDCTEKEAITAILNIGPCPFEILWKHINVTKDEVVKMN